MRKTCPNENLIEFLLLTTRISFDSSTTDIVTTDIGTTGIVTTGIVTTGIGTTVIGHNCYRHNCYRYTTDIGIQLLSGTTVIGTTVIAIQLISPYNCYRAQVLSAHFFSMFTKSLKKLVFRVLKQRRPMSWTYKYSGIGRIRTTYTVFLTRLPKEGELIHVKKRLRLEDYMCITC